MVKLVERIKNHYRHKSLYGMTVPELKELSRKQVENSRIYAFNTIVAIIFGQCFFWYEYQHMGIILTIVAVFIGVSSLSIGNYVEQIDQAIFLLESMEK